VIEKKEAKLRQSQQLALANLLKRKQLDHKWVTETQRAGLSVPNLKEQEYIVRPAE
jgi:hypothetical protein